MLGTSLTEVLHLRVATGGESLRLMREVAATMDLGVAAYDGRLGLLWANAIARDRLGAFTGVSTDEAATTLFSGSGTFPRWLRRDVAVGGQQLACLGVDFERGRSVLSALVVPAMDDGDQIIGLVTLVSPDGSGPLTEMPAAAAAWRAVLEPTPLAVAATRPDGHFSVVGGGGEVVLAGLRHGLGERIRSPLRDSFAEQELRFREGSATAGDDAITFAAPDGGLVRGRLVWMTVVADGRPLLKLDVFAPAPAQPEQPAAGEPTLSGPLFESAPDAIIVTRGRRVVTANPAVFDVLGIPPERLVGADLGSLAPPGDARIAALADRLDMGLEVPIRATVGCANGVSGMCEIDIHAAALEADDQETCVLVARTVRDAVPAEAEMSRVAAMLAVVDIASDDDGRLRGALDLVRGELDAAWVELVHLEPETNRLIEAFREPADVDTGGLSEDVTRLADLSRLAGSSIGPLAVDPVTGVPGAVEGGNAPPVLVQVVPSLSRGLWMLLSGCGRALTPGDGPRARRAGQAMGWVVDRVGAQRRADQLLAERELFAAALERAEPGLLLMSPDGFLLAANSAAARILGSSPGLIAGMPLPELFGDDLARVLRPAVEILGREGGLWEHELSGSSRFERAIRIRLRLEAVVGPDGGTRGLVGTVWDAARAAATDGVGCDRLPA